MLSHLSLPYNFTENSDFKEMLLLVIGHIRDEFHRLGQPKTLLVNSPTIYYKLSNVSEKLESCSEKKKKILVTLSITFLGGQWNTKHKKRNATIDKKTMEENIVLVFGEKIPWKTKPKKTTKLTE